ncbi:hypothetical protein H8S90_13900 [Olivibacter sp. SDN3]|uniref:hypothetical protein n=1 Tax=Olivibacter sp. SDN3 TaxID=2764720 RepID=UPI00165198D9|nr:hypothetical protein [Olivibacter sp. SDN3]QNL47912.1 hypothetical protein H8S90_13900 [Olivibacter sp. SDN3]
MKQEQTIAGPTKGKTGSQTIEHIKDGLQLTAQLILASPLKLPVKLVQGAKYVVLGLSIFDGLFKKKIDDPLKPQGDETNGT